MAREADFSEKTRDIVARRASFRCSVPDCRQITIGPGDADDECACIGQCCHIYSSSPDGPRGTGGLSSEQRQSPSNGFWACANHGKLIDTNEGGRFPARLLSVWKDCHEAMILRELRGVTTKFGWLQSVSLLSAPFRATPLIVELGKLTVLRGPNGSGKSAVCECIASLSDPKELWRWRRGSDLARRLEFETVYRNPTKHVLKTLCTGGAHVEFSLDGVDVPTQPLELKVVYYRQLHGEKLSDESDTEYIARSLGLDEAAVINLVPRIVAQPMFGVQRLEVRDGVEGYELFGDVRGTRPGLRFGAWSHSEQARVISAIAVSCAQFFASYSPTILLLDGGMSRLDYPSVQ